MGRARTDEVIEDLRTLKSRLERDLAFSRFILVGSRARGDWFLASDADLVVVSDSFRDLNFRHRREIVLRHRSERVDLEILCYTSEDFDRLRRRR